MKTIKPAFKHLWADLSPMARGLFVVSNALLICVFLVLIYSAFTESETRRYYRGLIQENHQTIEKICRNEKRLCE